MKKDKKAYKELIEWKSHIKSHFIDSVEVHIIGIHKKIPSFLKSIVRRFLNKKENILLDWGGKVADKYDFKGEVLVDYVTRNGCIKSISTGK